MQRLVSVLTAWLSDVILNYILMILNLEFYMPGNSLKNEPTSLNNMNPYNLAKAKQWAFKGAKFGAIGGGGLGFGVEVGASAFIAILAATFGAVTGNGDKPLEGRLVDAETLKTTLYGAGCGAAVGAGVAVLAVGAGRFGFRAVQTARTQFPRFFPSKNSNPSIEVPIPPAEETSKIRPK